MTLEYIIAIVGIASIVGVILFKTVQSIINIKN
jgi:hypothetical protein